MSNLLYVCRRCGYQEDSYHIKNKHIPMCFRCESTMYVGVKAPNKKPKFVADNQYKERNKEGL